MQIIRNFEFKKYLKFFLVFLVCIIFFKMFWTLIHGRLAEEKVKELCTTIKRDMNEDDVLKIISVKDIYHSKLDNNELFFLTKRGLPETPECRVYFSNKKVTFTKYGSSFDFEK